MTKAGQKSSVAGVTPMPKPLLVEKVSMYLLFKFLKKIYFMCMSGLPTCIHVYHMHAWYLGLLQKQQVLLSAEPSLQPLGASYVLH